MKHLHDAEFVDILEGTLAAERVAHARACEACRERVAALRSTLASAQLDSAPEPPAMFWQHFAARVNARLDTPEAATSWWTLPRFAFGSVLLLIAALVTFTYFARTQSVPRHEQIAVRESVPDLTSEDLDADEGWALVRAAAEDMDAADAGALAVSADPGAVDRMAVQLTQEERAELVRLVETELKRIGA